MGAPLKLDANELRHVAEFLDALSDASRKTGVRIGYFEPAGVTVANVTIEVAWDNDAEQYQLNDRVGS